VLADHKRVIYRADVRSCAKMRCVHEPSVTIVLRYADREIVIRDLVAERDPNLLDLCDEHAARMTAPVGWSVRDRREAPALVT
jgi:Protein of unknown function (DUF3499)